MILLPIFLRLSIETQEEHDTELVEFSTDDPKEPVQPKCLPLIDDNNVPELDQNKNDDLLQNTTKEKRSQMLHCKRCSYSTQRSFNLRRHILSKHGSEAVISAEEGGCICLTCRHKMLLYERLALSFDVESWIRVQIDDKRVSNHRR